MTTTKLYTVIVITLEGALAGLIGASLAIVLGGLGASLAIHLPLWLSLLF